jgi:hypothetical protein
LRKTLKWLLMKGRLLNFTAVCSALRRDLYWLHARSLVARKEVLTDLF